MNALKGDQHGCAKITEVEVIKLMDQITAGVFATVREVIEETGLSKSAVHAILNGRSWSHLPRPSKLNDSLQVLFANGRRRSNDF